MKLSRLASPLLALSLLGACAQAPELQGNPINPPGSGGGYNPSGGSGPSGSYGSGASGAGGPTPGADPCSSFFDRRMEATKYHSQNRAWSLWPRAPLGTSIEIPVARA